MHITYIIYGIIMIGLGLMGLLWPTDKPGNKKGD